MKLNDQMLREQKQQLWCVSCALRNLAYAPESKLTGAPRFRVTAWFEQVLQVQVAENLKVRVQCAAGAEYRAVWGTVLPWVAVGYSAPP